MLAITQSITPEKLNQKFEMPKPLVFGIDKKDEVLQTQNQMTKPKKYFYQPQLPSINKALLHG